MGVGTGYVFVNKQQNLIRSPVENNVEGLHRSPSKHTKRRVKSPTVTHISLWTR